MCPNLFIKTITFQAYNNFSTLDFLLIGLVSDGSPKDFSIVTEELAFQATNIDDSQ